MKKINVFSQVFYHFEIDSELIRETLELVEKEVYTRDFKHRTTLTHLHKKKEYKNLIDSLDKCLLDAQSQISFDCEYLKIVRLWANRSFITERHYRHIHQNSLISGILYLTPSESCTNFYLPNIWSCPNLKIDTEFDYQLLGLFKGENRYVKYSHTTKPGDLILFPSWIPHDVDAHDNEDDRYTIAFNVFPGGRIGSHEDNGPPIEWNVSIDVR